VSQLDPEFCRVLEAAMAAQQEPIHDIDAAFNAFQAYVSATANFGRTPTDWAKFYEAIDGLLIHALMVSISMQRPFARALIALVDGTTGVHA